METSAPSVQVELEMGKENEWLDVSPGKSSRTPPKSRDLEYGQVAILSNSCFSVLNSEEEGEIIEDVMGGDETKAVKSPQTKEKEVVIRQSLPRDSKNNHKVLGVKSYQKGQEAGPSDLYKKKSRLH